MLENLSTIQLSVMWLGILLVTVVLASTITEIFKRIPTIEVTHAVTVKITPKESNKEKV